MVKKLLLHKRTFLVTQFDRMGPYHKLFHCAMLSLIKILEEPDRVGLVDNIPPTKLLPQMTDDMWHVTHRGGEYCL